jgi:hypothetical protein
VVEVVGCLVVLWVVVGFIVDVDLDVVDSLVVVVDWVVGNGVVVVTTNLVVNCCFFFWLNLFSKLGALKESKSSNKDSSLLIIGDFGVGGLLSSGFVLVCILFKFSLSCSSDDLYPEKNHYQNKANNK